MLDHKLRSDQGSILSKYPIDKIFNEFKKRGIPDLAYLVKRIRKNSSIRHYASELGVDEEYLQALRKYLYSLIPKAKPLKNLPNVTLAHFGYLASFKSLGITNSYHLLTKGRTPSQRKNLASITGIPVEFIQTSVSFADLFQCTTMNSNRANLYMWIGISGAYELSLSEPDGVYQMLKNAYAEDKTITNVPSVLLIGADIDEAKRVVRRFRVEMG